MYDLKTFLQNEHFCCHVFNLLNRQRLVEKNRQTMFTNPNRVVFLDSALGCKSENKHIQYKWSIHCHEHFSWRANQPRFNCATAQLGGKKQLFICRIYEKCNGCSLIPNVRLSLDTGILLQTGCQCCSLKKMSRYKNTTDMVLRFYFPLCAFPFFFLLRPDFQLLFLNFFWKPPPWTWKI